MCAGNVIRHRPKGIRFASQIRDGKTADLLLFCFVHLPPLASVRKKLICFGIRGTARTHTQLMGRKCVSSASRTCNNGCVHMTLISDHISLGWEPDQSVRCLVGFDPPLSECG
jgi:hypothetical protein